ncbi:MAG: hypothetical protein AABX94_01980 [Nanoarchaeota archaeon]
MKNIKSMSISTIIIIIITVILTIWADLSKPLKDFLASLSGHHWVTKSLIAIILFIFLNFILSKSINQEKNVFHEVKKVIWTTVIGIITISGFYILHYLI